MVLTGLAGTGSTKNHHVCVPRENLNQILSKLRIQMLGHFKAKRSLEATPKIPRLIEILLAKKSFRNQKIFWGNVDAIHPKHIDHARFLRSLEPSAEAAANI